VRVTWCYAFGHIPANAGVRRKGGGLSTAARTGMQRKGGGGTPAHETIPDSNRGLGGGGGEGTKEKTGHTTTCFGFSRPSSNVSLKASTIIRMRGGVSVKLSLFQQTWEWGGKCERSEFPPKTRQGARGGEGGKLLLGAHGLVFPQMIGHGSARRSYLSR